MKYAVRAVDKDTGEVLTDTALIELSAEDMKGLAVQTLLAKSGLSFMLQPGQTATIEFRPIKAQG